MWFVLLKLVNFTRSFFVFRALWKNFRWCHSTLAIVFLFLFCGLPFHAPDSRILRASKGDYDNHSSCLNCSGCFRSSCCSVCRSWPDLTWSLVEGHWRFSDRQMGRKKDAKVKEWKDSAYRNSSSSRPGLEQTVARDDPFGSTADGHDDDAASVLSLSSSGGGGLRGNTQVPGSRSSHGTPGLSRKGRRTHRSTPARSHACDLAGKYGVQAPAKDFEATLLGPNPPPGDSDRVMLSTDRSPLSESKRPVERPSSCDTGHNARLAMKGSVQQSSINRPVNSEHVPVTPGPGSGLMTCTRYRDPVPGTRGSVPPTKPGKPGATTTPVTPSDSVTLGDPVRPVYTGQKAQKEKTDQCLDQSELPVLNSPDRSVQLEHNVHKQPGNMPILQADNWSEHSKVFHDFTNSDSLNVKAYESPERTQLQHSGHRSLGISHTGNPSGIGHTGNRSDQEHGSSRTRHHSDVSRSSRRDSNTHRNTIPLRHADLGEHSPASMIRHRPARSRSPSYDSVSPRRHSRSPSRLRGKKKKSHKKRKHSSTSSSSSCRSSSSSSTERERKRHKSKRRRRNTLNHSNPNVIRARRSTRGRGVQLHLLLLRLLRFLLTLLLLFREVQPRRSLEFRDLLLRLMTILIPLLGLRVLCHTGIVSVFMRIILTNLIIRSLRLFRT